MGIQAVGSGLLPLGGIGYAELITAAAFGYVIFDDIPDRYTWLGAALIVGSGLVVVWRESARRKSNTSN